MRTGLPGGALFPFGRTSRASKSVIFGALIALLAIFGMGITANAQPPPPPQPPPAASAQPRAAPSAVPSAHPSAQPTAPPPSASASANPPPPPPADQEEKPVVSPNEAELARGQPIAKVVLAGNRRVSAEDI